MATFISTTRFTEQGIQNVKDTCTRANDFKSAAKKMGVKVQDIYSVDLPIERVVEQVGSQWGEPPLNFLKPVLVVHSTR